MVQAAGDHFLKLLAFYAAAKVAVFVGLTISALISSAETLPTKKLILLTSCIASSVTSKDINIHYFISRLAKVNGICMLIDRLVVVVLRWSVIASRLPGRTDNEIKNYWNTHLRRKLLNKGIDPSAHRPINDDSTLHNMNTSVGAALKEQKITGTYWCKTENMLGGIEECQELNLDLRICPPSENPPQSLQSRGRKFSSNQGLKSRAECRCNTSNSDWFKLK